MGTYYYYVSTRSRAVEIDGVRTDVNLYAFSHKLSFRGEPSYISARLARNENVWAGREPPKFIMHDGASIDDYVFHWKPGDCTHYVEGAFRVLLGKLQLRGRRSYYVERFHTMVVTTGIDNRDAFQRSVGEQFHAAVTGAMVQPFIDKGMSGVYLHSPTAEGALMAKLMFTSDDVSVEPFTGWS